MGKSPGKWIKTVILGKKHSKSNLSKGAEVENDAILQQPQEYLHLDYSVLEETPNQSYDKVEGAEAKSENGTRGTVSCEPVKELIDFHGVAGLSSVDDEAVSRLEQAAIKVQAACRGYLARQSFWSLKGIIRLQALIRGHLVRKQAVATLHCLYCVVRFQALARGRMVRILYPGLELSRNIRVQEVQDTTFLTSVETTPAFGSEKLSKNAFASKLLSLLPKAMALSLQYGPEEPNSAWMWLNRWSLIRFWEPLASPKARSDVVKSQAKLLSEPTVVARERGKSRRTFRKVVSAISSENAGSDNKPRRNPRALVSHQTPLPQEPQQSEPEKVNHKLKEISVAKMAGDEKPLETQGKSPEAEIVNPGEQPSAKLGKTENISDSLNIDDPVVGLVKEPNPLEKGTKKEIEARMNKELMRKEDEIKKEKKKTKRRKSLPGKQEHGENVSSQNRARLPSYMAATESAKGKLRRTPQGSAKIISEEEEGEDGDKNVNFRRHSLPVSTNGKLTSLSSRQPNGKQERVLQHGWRR